jgi:hypothetical protein
MVICPQLLIPPAEIQAWASSFKAVNQQLSSSSSQSSIAVALSSVSVALGAGILTVNAVGTLSGSIGGGILQLQQMPFSASVPFSLTPLGSPQADEIIDFTIVGSGPVINIPGSGSAALLNSLISIFQPFVTEQLQNSLSPWAEQLIPDFVAAALALPQLPPSTTITLRSLKVDESGITLQPVLGTIGTGLSTFKPAPLPAS